MATRLVIDADLTEEDLRRDLIEVEIPGVGVAEFPGVINSLAVMRVARMSAAGRRDDLTPSEIIALMGDLVPDGVVAEWSRKGFQMLDPVNVPVLEKVIKALLAEYERRDAVIEAAGPPGKEQTTTATTPPPFSNSGLSSSPTSAPIPGSPFPLS